jgi:hypothetical protein
MEGQNDGKSATKERHQLTSEWGKAMKREEALAGQSLLYAEERERERERGGVVPHVGDRTSASSWTNGAMVRVGFPYFASLTSGPQSDFE